MRRLGFGFWMPALTLATIALLSGTHAASRGTATKPSSREQTRESSPPKSRFASELAQPARLPNSLLAESNEGLTALARQVTQPMLEPPVLPTNCAISVPPADAVVCYRPSALEVQPNPSYGHAPDYRWLTGELSFSPVRNAWRLRFADAEEDDAYGGSVTLIAPASPTTYHNGQRVRIEGELNDPCSQEPSPAYRVHYIQPLPPP
jgi:hypothetical protein